MTDSRLSQVKALVDDARTLIADIEDELPLLDPRNDPLITAREHLNEALLAVLEALK